jgi:Ca-activated chloride channel family protein
VLKATAVELIRQLRGQDILSVVAFNDYAETILQASTQANNLKSEGKIRSLQTRGGTEIYQGLRLGLGEVRKNLSPYYINHIILVTDGHTYGDEASCQELAKRAAEQNIGISCLGIGGQWNDVFLDSIANITGGGCFYISDPRDIRVFLKEKFNTLGQVLVEGINLNLHEGPGVRLNYAYRLHPEANVLPLSSPIRLGNIPKNHHLSFILEFVISPIAPSVQKVLLMEGSLTFKIPKLGSREQRVPLNLFRSTSPNIQQSPPSKLIIEALSRLTLYRMQDDAKKELNRGNYQGAYLRLQNMATHLFSQGEVDLAKTTLREAKHIQHWQRYSDEGEKRIKYGTQALFLPDTARRESKDHDHLPRL